MKKILINYKYANYWSKKLSHIKELEITSDIQNKEIEIIFGHSKDILISNFRFYKNLKWIQLLSAGVDEILDNSNKEIISKYIITTSKGIHGQSMYEYVLHGILSLKNGNIFEKKKFDNWIRTRRNLALKQNQNILILGLGNIGKFMAEKFSNMNMNVDALVTSVRKNKYINRFFNDLKKIPLHKYSIIISTLPLTNQTRHIINDNFFNLVSKDVIFINLGRGETVDDLSLFNALSKKNIGGAILDVFSEETQKNKNYFFCNLNNCLCSPHIAGYFYESHNLFIEKFEKLFELYCKDKLKSDINLHY